MHELPDKPHTAVGGIAKPGLSRLRSRWGAQDDSTPVRGSAVEDVTVSWGILHGDNASTRGVPPPSPPGDLSRFVGPPVLPAIPSSRMAIQRDGEDLTPFRPRSTPDPVPPGTARAGRRPWPPADGWLNAPVALGGFCHFANGHAGPGALSGGGGTESPESLCSDPARGGEKICI